MHGKRGFLATKFDILLLVKPAIVSGTFCSTRARRHFDRLRRYFGRLKRDFDRLRGTFNRARPRARVEFSEFDPGVEDESRVRTNTIVI